ncbi:hypothetical protein QYF61_020222 [Mycteria americana]|uniref:Uncharacterized protein n=1 Tax=Mycteria americana TaxID=33587 RepID=A0AAN7NE70_MYCAM|nr:hypothetical protein QYF61_020222 [Mycteria americana]
MNLYTLLDSKPFSTTQQVRGLLGQGTLMTHLVEIKFSCCQFRILSTQLQWMSCILCATLLEKFSALLYSREMEYKLWLSLNQCFVPRRRRLHSMEQISMQDAAH